MARKNDQGTYVEPSEYNFNVKNPPRKTLYDPNIISDTQMINWTTEAATNAIKLDSGAYKGTYNNLEFIFNEQTDGTFRYYPQMPINQGVK